MAERVFGITIRNSEGKDIPVRPLVETHILEDLGFIPTLQDWLKELPISDWMFKKSAKLSETLDKEDSKGIKEKSQKLLKTLEDAAKKHETTWDESKRRQILPIFPYPKIPILDTPHSPLPPGVFLD